MKKAKTKKCDAIVNKLVVNFVKKNSTALN